jgi:hypothetical protein
MIKFKKCVFALIHSRRDEYIPVKIIKINQKYEQ